MDEGGLMKADIDKNGKLILYRDGMKKLTAICPYAHQHQHCKCECPKLIVSDDSINVCGTKIWRKQ